MTREEEILNAAREYNNGITLSSPSNVLHFEAGAQWADEHPKNVWHDPEEEPLDAKDLLLIDTKGCVWVGYVSHTNGAPRWKTYVQKGKVAKWAYVDDILPKGGEE